MSPTKNRLKLGRKGEKVAADYLRSQGFVVLRRGYRCSRGEIDLVCRDGDHVVFIEVKTRASFRGGYPEEAITEQKRRRLLRAAQQFLVEHRLDRVRARFDVVAIRWRHDQSEAEPEITHYANAFGAQGL